MEKIKIDVDASDTLYGYGKETTNNYVRIFSLYFLE